MLTRRTGTPPPRGLLHVPVRQHSGQYAIASVKARQMTIHTVQQAKALQGITLLKLKADAAHKNSKCKTVRSMLSIDGGGMRGIIPARVLEEVEDAIRETIWSCKDTAEFKARYEALPPEVKASKDIPVDLADYFDLVAGTSTRSILAAFVATKGVCCDDNIVQDKLYKKGFDDFKAHIGKGAPAQDSGQLVRGSARSAQALFVATGHQIFAWGPRPIMRLAAGLAAIPVLGSVIASLGPAVSFVCNLFRPKFWEKGIDEVLQRSFGGGGYLPKHDTSKRSAHEIGLSASASGTDARPGGMFTSLLIPTFHIDYNRAVAFWHKHSSNPTDHAWGYSTLNRLRPPVGFEVQPAPPPISKMFSDTNILTQFRPGDSAAEMILGMPAARVKPHSAVRRQELLAPAPAPAPARVQCRTGPYSVSKRVPMWCMYGTWTFPCGASCAPAQQRQPTSLRQALPAQELTPANVGSPSKPLLQKYSLLAGNFADGGLVANNPTLAAIAVMRKTVEANSNKLAVLSLGCGSYIQKLKVNRYAGVIGWGMSVINVAMGASVEASAAFGEQLFQEAALSDNESPHGPGSPSSSSSGKPSNRFLRVQAVGFAEDATLDFDQPHVPQVPVNRTGAANYLALGYKGSSEQDQKLGASLAALDNVDDWQDLLEVGDRLATHYRNDLRAWVKAYVLGL